MRKRIFIIYNFHFISAMEFTFDTTIPMNDLNAAIEISVPFSFTVPTAASRRSEREGRSFSSSGGPSVRSKMYRALENYVGMFTGADGQ